MGLLEVEGEFQSGMLLKRDVYFPVLDDSQIFLCVGKKGAPFPHSQWAPRDHGSLDSGEGVSKPTLTQNVILGAWNLYFSAGGSNRRLTLHSSFP